MSNQFSHKNKGDNPMKKYIIKISLIIFCLLFLASCGGSSSNDSSDTDGTESETDTTTPVVTVAGLTFASLSTTESSITFTWTDPEDTDFDHVAVTCSDGTDSEDAEIAAGTENYTQSTLNANALTVETCYTFTFAAEDSEGNTLESGSLLVMTSPSGAGALTYTLITSAEELYNIRDDLAGSYYLLTDISLSDYSPDNGVTMGWYPIGDEEDPFTGIFFGAGHIVSDLTIDRSDKNQGLFGISAGKGMYYLGLEDVDVNGGYKTGALVGMVDLSESEGGTHTITHCYVTGKVVGDSGYSIGGLVGDLYASSGTSVLSDCYSTADVSNGADNAASSSNIGGLVGTNWVWTGTSSITDCYATGAITAYSAGAGGLVGQNTAFNDNGTVTISGCYATGEVSGTGSLGGLVGINCTNMSTSVIEISGCHATGDVTGTADYIGGLTGYNENHGTTTLSDCYATGNVTGGEYLGGLSGYYEIGSGHTLTVSDCSASGDVTGDGYLGGLSGYHDNEGTLSISDCDATGDVTGGYYAGGLVGFDDCEKTSNISRCTASGAVSGVDYIGGLIGEAYTDSGGDITVSCVYASGSVSGNGYVGGLCGNNYIQSTGSSSIITIENAYATGAVSGTSDYIGGLIGDNGYYSTTVYPNFEITNCYATGAVSGSSSSMGGLLGGAITSTARETIENCFYDSETTGYVSGSWTDAGTATSTSDMQTESTFTNAGWDFIDETANGTDDIWTLDDSATDPANGGYPYLSDLPPVE
jgi:hypothetical protein